MSCVDWVPTVVGGLLGRSDLLVDSALVSPYQRLKWDGVDQWDAILKGSTDTSGGKKGPGELLLKAW